MPDSHPQDEDNNGMGLVNMNKGQMMYMDIGAGLGKASHWSSSSFAMDAMTMGFYMGKNLGVEIGMGLLAESTFANRSASINTVHVAGKGIVPFTDLLAIYAKLGAGVSFGHGHRSAIGIANVTDAGPYYGLGLFFNITPRVAVYVEDSGIVIIPNRRFGNVNQV